MPETHGEWADNRVGPDRHLEAPDQSSYHPRSLGEVSEWLKEPHSKCGLRETAAGVRIPPSPVLANKHSGANDDTIDCRRFGRRTELFVNAGHKAESQSEEGRHSDRAGQFLSQPDGQGYRRVQGLLREARL